MMKPSEDTIVAFLADIYARRGAEALAPFFPPVVTECVRVRLWDDQGKVAGRETPDFVHYVPLLGRVVRRHMLELHG